MATFKEIRGQLIKKYTTNPTDPLEGQMWYNNTTGTLKGRIVSEAWSSGSDMITAKRGGAGFGTQAALVFAAGITPPGSATTDTQEYNGSGWATGTVYPGAKYNNTGFGTLTAGVSLGGVPATTDTFEYDGTNWAAGGVYPAPTSLTFTHGTLTAGIASGGAPAVTTTNTYNGTAWTASPASMNTGRGAGGMAGTTTAAVCFAGGTGPDPGIGQATEEFNGSAWTSVTNTPATVEQIGSTGTQTAAIYFGGRTPVRTNSFTYDGTSFTASAALGAARYTMARGTLGTQAASICAGGFTGTANVTATEEFNRSTDVVTAGAWASGNVMTLGRYNAFSYGTQDAAVASSNDGTYVTTTEEYDGTNWTGGGVVNTGRGGGRAGGTQAAGIVFAGYTGSNSTATETYNGTAYATSPATMATGRRNLASSTNSPAPTATAFGGYVTASSAVTEEFNGTAWATSPGSMTTARYKLGGAGTQTAALAFGGIPAPGGTPQSITEEYDGSTWTAGGALGTAMDQITGTGVSTAALAFGGNPAITTTQGYDGTAWSTRPALGTGRGYMMGCGTGTSALGIGGQAPPTGTTATEKFTGETSAANIVTVTTS